MRNRKNIIIAVMIAVVLLMITGYAAFRTQLNINAIGNITSEWNIYFESISEGTPTGSAVNNFAPSVNGTTAVMSADFAFPGDAMTYDIKLVNNGTIDAVIEDIEAVSEGSDVIIFDIIGIKKGDKLKAKSDITFQVTIKFDDVTSYPGEIGTDLTVNIKTVQDTGQDVTEEDIFVEGQDENFLVTKILGRNKSNIVSSGDGLYVSTATNDGRPTYYYKGNVENNYVQFGSREYTYTRSFCKMKDEYIDDYDGLYVYGYDNEWTDERACAQSTMCLFSDGSFYPESANSCSNSGGTAIYGIYGWTTEKVTTTAPYIWRIVRINEDGTVKLISETDIIPSAEYYVSFSGYYSDSDVGNSYEEGGLKKVVDNWYNSNMLSYQGYIATTNFCESAKVKAEWLSSTGNARMEEILNYTPDFKCSLDGNGKQYVSAKAGLITVDELLMSGMSYSTSTNTYLNNISDYYWSMSPAGVDTGDAMWVGDKSMGVFWASTSVSGYDILPVISLKANTRIEESKGNGIHGSSTNPYVIKIN